MQQFGDAAKAAALVLATQVFLANRGGGGQTAAARLLHRRGGRAAVAAWVDVAGDVPTRNSLT
jgi:hypothetical protein